MPLREILRTQFAFLAFLPIRPDLRQNRGAYLGYVLAVTWLVGIGRYWDHPSAYAWQYAGFGWYATTIATLLPISAIAATLTSFNLEHVTFDLMAGIREEQMTPNDLAYGVVFMLGLVSYIAAPVTLLGYLAAIVVRWRATRKPPRGLVPGPKDSNLERADTKE